MPARLVGDWFWVPRPRYGPGLRLVCVPHAGGDAPGYAALAQAAPEDVEVWAVRMPARGGRYTEPAAETMEQLVGWLVDAVLTHVEPPYVLAGQSFGGALAYEMCRVLEDVSPPAGLVVASVLPPHRWPGLTEPATTAELVEFLHRVGSESISLLSEPIVRDYAIAALRADLSLRLPFRESTGLLGVPLHALGGWDDTVVPPPDMTDWARYTTGPFRQTVLPAGHFLMQSHAREVADAVLPGFMATPHDM